MSGQGQQAPIEGHWRCHCGPGAGDCRSFEFVHPIGRRGVEGDKRQERWEKAFRCGWNGGSCIRGRRPGLAPETEEYAATIAASVARFYLRRGRAVGLVVSGVRTDVLPPDRGGRQFDKILESLALMNAIGFTPFAGMVANQCRHLPRGSTVVLVTPSVGEEIALVVDQVIRLGLRPVVVLINADSFKGSPGTDRLAMTIAPLGVPVATISKGDNIGLSLGLAGAQAGEFSLVPSRTNEIL